MSSPQAALDRYGADAPYRSLADAYRSLERWTGDDPVLLVAEAAASTTGQSFVGGVKPAVERFRDAFVATGRATAFADLAAVDLEDDDLVEAFGAQRKRRVLLEIAAVLADRPEDDDLSALQGWAAAADHYGYADDPIGSISGVGPASFQTLRQLAGVATVSPDPEVRTFLETVGEDLADAPLATDTALRTIASCEWLAVRTSYDLLEIDRLAWWTVTDPDEREALLEASAVDAVG